MMQEGVLTWTLKYESRDRGDRSLRSNSIFTSTSLVRILVIYLTLMFSVENNKLLIKGVEDDTRPV